MEFRMGVNLGDVIEDGEQILGDGVNIAARLESLSDAGGICISGTAFDHVRNKLELGYDYLGEQSVKNIALPVRVYKVLMEPEAAAKVLGEKKAKPRQWQRVAIGLVVVLIVIAAVIAIWKFYIRPTLPLEVASKEKMAFPLPDEPSIAVLPFVNMSGDPKQEFLCDGITEEIITALSKVRHLFVISRQSTFSYKGKPVKVKQVSEELGVRYVLEGSVQRSGDRIRITAQLIDALTGNHLWAERYERDLKDIFALQDEITMKVLTATQVKLTMGEQALGIEKYFKGKQGLDCYLKYLEGAKYNQGLNIEDNRVARRIAEEVISMCPENPMGYFLLADVYQIEFFLGSGKSPQESIEKGIQMAQKVLAMDDSIGLAHGVLGHLYALKKEHDKGIAEKERALALDPGGARLHMWYAMSLNWVGRSEEAITIYQKGFRLNPFGDTRTFLNYGTALRDAKRFEEALSAYRKALQREPNNIFAHTHLAALYIMMGHEKEARAEAAEVLRINPKFSVDIWAKAMPYKDQSHIDKLINAWRKAGLK
jgi:adenylate cyclase